MISVFSPAWFGTVAGVVILLVLIPLLFRKKDRELRLKFMSVFCLVIFIGWIGYKIVLWQTADYDFIFWNELPLHVCNLISLIAIFAAWKDNHLLQGLCFYVGSLGAIFAMFMPPEGFYDVPFFSGMGLGYWGYHSLVIVECISFVTLGIFRPKYKDVLKVLGFFFVLAAAIHCINLGLRYTLYDEANYFYTFGIPGNPIMDGLYTLIPKDLFFSIPLLPAIGVVNLLMTLLVRSLSMKKQPASV